MKSSSIRTSMSSCSLMSIHTETNKSLSRDGVCLEWYIYPGCFSSLSSFHVCSRPSGKAHQWATVDVFVHTCWWYTSHALLWTLKSWGDEGASCHRPWIYSPSFIQSLGFEYQRWLGHAPRVHWRWCIAEDNTFIVRQDLFQPPMLSSQTGSVGSSS